MQPFKTNINHTVKLGQEVKSGLVIWLKSQEIVVIGSPNRLENLPLWLTHIPGNYCWWLAGNLKSQPSVPLRWTDGMFSCS